VIGVKYLQIYLSPLEFGKNLFVPNIRTEDNLNSFYLKGPPGRLRLLSFSVTNLFKLERIELPYHKCGEVQGYAERVSGKRPI